MIWGCMAIKIDEKMSNRSASMHLPLFEVAIKEERVLSSTPGPMGTRHGVQYSLMFTLVFCFMTVLCSKLHLKISEDFHQ